MKPRALGGHVTLIGFRQLNCVHHFFIHNVATVLERECVCACVLLICNLFDVWPTWLICHAGLIPWNHGSVSSLPLHGSQSPFTLIYRFTCRLIRGIKPLLSLRKSQVFLDIFHKQFGVLVTVLETVLFLRSLQTTKWLITVVVMKPGSNCCRLHLKTTEEEFYQHWKAFSLKRMSEEHHWRRFSVEKVFLHHSRLAVWQQHPLPPIKNI